VNINLFFRVDDDNIWNLFEMGNELNKQDGKNNKRDPNPKKKPIPPPPRVGRKKKSKGIDAAAKLPSGISLEI